MSDTLGVSPEELFATRASAQALAEANAFRTVETAFYKAQGTKYDGKLGQPSEAYPKGRLTVNCKADLFKEDKKVGSVGFFISPHIGRTSSGKLDREIRLYNQLARTLYPNIKSDAELAAISTGELLERFTQYPIGVFVTETFSSQPDEFTQKKSYQDAKTSAEAKELRERGWKAANYVQSIGKVK